MRRIPNPHPPYPPVFSFATGRVLIVDDDEFVTNSLRIQLEAAGHEIFTLADGEAALDQYEAIAPEVTIVDLWMPGSGGLLVLSGILRVDPAASVILMSGDVDVPTAVRALRSGAEDVLAKPVDHDLLATSIDRGLRRSRLVRAHRAATAQLHDPYGLLDDSPAMQRVLRTLERMAQHSLPVLICGEPGTGKQAVAEMLHQLSPRSSRPFVRISCPELRRIPLADERPEEANPSMSTDVAQGVVSANHGSLFLDEVCGLSPSDQASVLTLVAGRNGDRGVVSDVRVIAATERDILADVGTGRLRSDLYQRLAVLSLSLPSLRSRGDAAIRILASRALDRLRHTLGRGPLRLTRDALALIVSVDWPGNVRQLNAVIEEAFFLAFEQEEVNSVHLRSVLERLGLEHVSGGNREGDLSLTAVERRHIAHVLSVTGGQRSEAARRLGITRSTLYKKMNEYQLERIGTG